MNEVKQMLNNSKISGFINEKNMKKPHMLHTGNNLDEILKHIFSG
jgi:hypothetical protein